MPGELLPGRSDHMGRIEAEVQVMQCPCGVHAFSPPVDRDRVTPGARRPPGNRLEVLSGDRAGCYSIRINAQWRLCFAWHNGDAHAVEIVDFH
ncbi:type II toxin-antitoxin system RelE/ParE family toxin [Thiorhodovibrio frisius]|uniref:Plasmid maintenance system killer protein n=1 Tax=Thiorhodovibrio frisius TaxID=631362 RepID=H8Z106_9GAMM|nr:type II toxin-antitoxin system RelE/ParE family toxin [Thiorhodovibrio frisius]EIC22427.1 plasmid maintenance system killer protein [Thiorhodovibrio frisius]WPL24726.1 Toxin HigB-1 [Thiorhodovibrio frisius]